MFAITPPPIAFTSIRGSDTTAQTKTETTTEKSLDYQSHTCLFSDLVAQLPGPTPMEKGSEIKDTVREMDTGITFFVSQSFS